MPTDTLRVSPGRLDEAIAPEVSKGVASLRTSRFAVEAVLFLMLAGGGALLLWGSTFVTHMVHDQLSAQKIFFPAKGSDALDPAIYPGLQRYAGQAVNSGPKAKAYANQFIAVHVTHIAEGKTYAEVSAAAQKSPNDAVLAAQADSLFIASITSVAAFVAAGVVFLTASHALLHVDPR